MFHYADDLDALSEILDHVRLHGDSVARCAPAEPFRVEVPDGTRLLHLVERGPLRLRVGDEPEIVLGTGDLVLLATGAAHAIYTDAQVPARPLEPADYFRVDAERPDPTPRWVTGTFAVHHEVAGPLLSVLPSAIHLTAAPDREWLAFSLIQLLGEIVACNPGAAVMNSRILDLLLIHTLRWWFAVNEAPPSWLTAAMDPALGPVLAAIHRDPAAAWTVTDLAAVARMSRSAFAERFTRQLGKAPVAYATERRLDHAAHLLRATADPVSRIAHRVGYASDAAFSRAFQRQFGAPPLRWRRG
ncbi:cupin domain-containing protein [Nocardia sp. NPDC052566]|uniref:AraC family transcriptional regulator n=1 Tax=Nocardia sp. NPDC052566 TaxID=3364330 RepID=UPI0037CB5DDB